MFNGQNEWDKFYSSDFLLLSLEGESFSWFQVISKWFYNLEAKLNIYFSGGIVLAKSPYNVL